VTAAVTAIGGVLLDARLLALRCALPMAMRALPLPALFRVIQPRRIWPVSETRALRSIVRSEVAAARLRAPDTCLYRAMTRFVGLRTAGIPARFRMGVRRDDSEAAHAWVEVEGVPVGEEADERLIATYSFP
jgi:hypothetical protein